MRSVAVKHLTMLLTAATAAGFASAVYTLYPGVMTGDAGFVYADIAKGAFGDWQSPVMTVLWSLIDPIAPGSGSMMLLTVALYWLAFGLLAMEVGRRSPRLALLLPLLALSPPAIIFVGVIWRDILFAAAWLLAAAVVFASVGHGRKPLAFAQALGLPLLAFGVLLRPNALAAAPFLAVYVLWPSGFLWRRTAAFVLPAALVLFGLVQVVYYDLLGAARQHPGHSIMVFDLGGISHFSKENVFPGAWTTDDSKLVTESCYHPTAWDIYWTLEPCRFVMDKLGREGLFGSSALVDAWLHGIANHPPAYLKHRVAFMTTFLADAEFTMGTPDVLGPTTTRFRDGIRLIVFEGLPGVLTHTPLSRGSFWLLLDAFLCLFVLSRRNTPAGAFVLGVCGSAVVYTASFLIVGVATDFRYHYWAVLAGLTGSIVAVRQRTTRLDDQPPLGAARCQGMSSSMCARGQPPTSRVSNSQR